MDYQSALSYLYGRVNYEQLSPKPSDLKLDRMHALLRRLGDPHLALRTVHVAGSKGKGSTAAMLAAILTRAGYRSGLFTSPHLSRIEERVRIDGEAVSADEFASVVEELAPAVAASDAVAKHAGDRPTFFELLTAVGFLAFRRRRVEAAVIEVGLGGRFDSTNVIRRPLAALITSISFDHTQQLGPTLTRIAGEKAGIVKPRSPVVSGATAVEARDVIRDVCRRRSAPLIELDRDFRYEYEPGLVTADQERRARVRIATSRRVWPVMELGLMGEHQAANAAVAVATVELLSDQGLAVSDAAVADGLASVRWPARLEVMRRTPLIVLDCAHNVASARALAEALTTSFPRPSGGRRLLVFAGSNDKDLAGMFAVLAPLFDRAFLTKYTNSPRGVASDRLADIWKQAAGGPFEEAPSPTAAWRAARAAAGVDDLVCVTGSVFLAGELRSVVMIDEGTRIPLDRSADESLD